MFRIVIIIFKLHGNQDLRVIAISFNKSAYVLDSSAFYFFIGEINLTIWGKYHNFTIITKLTLILSMLNLRHAHT